MSEIVAECAELLPTQGPIDVFVHHNTLHAFERLPFREAVRQAWEIYGAEPYLAESRYRQLLDSGRIPLERIESVLKADGEQQPSSFFSQHPEFGDRFALRREMMRSELRSGSAAELRWVIAETNALEQFCEGVERSTQVECLQRASDADFASTGRTPEAAYLRRLWEVCLERVSLEARFERQRHVRPRDALFQATGVDTDLIVADVLIRFSAAFLDQGFADWELPGREKGFFPAFLELYGTASFGLPPWMRGLPGRARRIREGKISAWDSIEESLIALGIAPSDQALFLRQTLLALPGWAGMIHQMENAPKWVEWPAPPDSLVGFLAVRLILDELAAEFVAAEHGGIRTPVCHLMEHLSAQANSSDEQGYPLAFELFQIAQRMGWRPTRLRDLDDFSELLAEIDAFDSVARRSVFQRAYEEAYYASVLDAVAVAASENESFSCPRSPSPRPTFQWCCCIDDREESFRRHLEEIAPDCETFGAAGFFAVAMNYKGVGDASYKPLCPAVVTPDHYVRENVGYTFAGEHRRRSETRRLVGRLSRRIQSGSRSFFGGIATSVFGSIAAFPLVARVLFPRVASKLRSHAARLMQPPPVTQLQLERYQADPGPDGGHVGYSIEEMTAIVRRLLQDIGCVDRFARLFVVSGHGSSSVNNPHSSAYNCGACAGKRGGPNARAFAQMANDYRVRSRLAEQGVRIPDDTWFLGAYHNTCDESVGWYDLDRLPPSHFELFSQTKATIDAAILQNAHERCRRFQAVRPGLAAAEALRHVQRRSEDLSQVRPEYNHATNSLCFVGRRAWSRNLFLDRRAFLTSYDPSIDDSQGSILERILAAAIPVCAGINLEYYFSSVDNVKYGSGSKLPHNLVSMLGVVEGATSDLRTGLYHQMVEIHEPMRLLFVIESSQEILTRMIESNEAIGRLVSGHWVHLAIIDPVDGHIERFTEHGFEPYQPEHSMLTVVERSRDWYGTSRGCRPPAMVMASRRRTVNQSGAGDER